MLKRRLTGQGDFVQRTARDSFGRQQGFGFYCHNGRIHRYMHYTVHTIIIILLLVSDSPAFAHAGHLHLLMCNEQFLRVMDVSWLNCYL